MVQLERATVTRSDLGLFYSSCIRSITDYAVPAFHFSLAKYSMQELECIQTRRTKSIICLGVSNNEALVIMNLKKLGIHHGEIRETLFYTIENDKQVITCTTRIYLFIKVCATF